MIKNLIFLKIIFANYLILNKNLTKNINILSSNKPRRDQPERQRRSNEENYIQAPNGIMHAIGSTLIAQPLMALWNFRQQGMRRQLYLYFFKIIYVIKKIGYFFEKTTYFFNI